MVAARTRRAPRAAAKSAGTKPLHPLAHAAHLLFHALHLPLPAVAAVATHVSAPDREGEDRETDRPPEDEAEDHQHDPAGVKADRRTTPAVLPVASIVVVAFTGGHRSPSLARMSIPFT